MTPVDILAIVAHPDDAELSCGGTLKAYSSSGKRVAIIDLTEGEMATRGTVALRREEARQSAEILGLVARENLGLPDCHFENDLSSRMAVIQAVRYYRPQIVFTNAPNDRHPDHAKASRLVYDACFYSGLKKIITIRDGVPQVAWRPRKVFFIIQSNYLKPDFLFDVSPFWSAKLQSIKAFKSQFYDPDSKEENTFISTPEFMEFIHARAREWGQSIGVQYAEGFITAQPFGIKDIFDLQ